MSFPVPSASTLESNDAARDERKREASPPSSFYAQSQAVLTAVRYYDELNSGYPGAAKKHMNRVRSALFAQLMAAFEYSAKDFLAQVLDATHIYDDGVGSWKWVDVDVASVLSTREGTGRIGSVLIHPLLGWQQPEELNRRFRDVFKQPLIWDAEIRPLKDLWIVRHSVSHNGGFVTHPDARRLRSSALSNRQVLLDLKYLESATNFLRTIVLRLESNIGPALLKRWFAEAAAGDWSQDEDFYRRVKLITTCVQSRPKELPTIDAAAYAADLAAYGT